MKFIYYGKFRRSWDTEAYIARALRRAGHEVREFDQERLNAERLPYLIDRLGGCDVLLTAKPPGGIVRVMSELRERCCTVSWSFDLVHHSFRLRRWRWAKAISDTFDIFACSDGYSIRELGRGVTLRQGIGDDVRAGRPIPEYDSDVLFIGSPYDSRLELVEKLSARYGDRFKIARSVRGDALSDLMVSTKVVVGPMYPSMPHYWSNRLYVVLGYGGCFCAPTIEGMESDDGIVAGIHYAPYRDNDDVCDVVDSLLADDAKRERIRRAGQQHVLRNLTYDDRVKTLVRLIEEFIARRG